MSETSNTVTGGNAFRT